MKNEEKKIVYAEPADYFQKEIREKYKLGEFAEPEQDETPHSDNISDYGRELV